MRNYFVYLSTLLVIGYFTTKISAEVRKCLEDKDCRRRECCAQAFYLFRCERIGYRNGDSCGLCGCRKGMTCVAEGINPFKILSGRGVCRVRPSTIAEVTTMKSTTIDIFNVVPITLKDKKKKPARTSTESWPSSRMMSPTTTSTLPPRSNDPETSSSRPSTSTCHSVVQHKDRFHEIFRPIYEQFISAAASMAGITMDDDITTTKPNKINTTSNMIKLT